LIGVLASAHSGSTISDVYAVFADHDDHRADIDTDLKVDGDRCAEIKERKRGTLVERLAERKTGVPDNTRPPG